MKKQDQKTKTAQRTAKDFIKKLTALQSDKELENWIKESIFQQKGFTH